MHPAIKYEFEAVIWRHSGPAGWYFVTIPNNLSTEIRDQFKWQEEGWGRLPATAKIKEFEWKTAIWFDTKLNAYILPIKSEVRRKFNLLEKEQVAVGILL